jgi:hypothetical protein
MTYFTSEKEANLLQNKRKINIKSPMKNSADILIVYTAIRQQLDYLITDDKKTLKKF